MNMHERRWAGAASAAASGILFALSLDMGPWGPLALVAPVPILLYALATTRTRSAAGWAFVAGLMGRLALIYAYLDVFPPIVLAFWMLALPLWFMGIVLATRWLAHEGNVWAALLSYPLLTTASEFLFDLVSPHGSFGALGYAMSGILPVVQLASLGGVAALTFFTAFVPMALVLMIRMPARRRAIALAAGFPVAAALVFGGLRLTEDYERQTRVALVAIDSRQDDELASPVEAMNNATAYADLAATLVDRSPDLILIPEKALLRRPGWPETGAPLEAAVKRIGIPIVAGFDETLADGSHNNVAEFIRSQQPSVRYLKRRLIPGLEAEFNPGKDSFSVGTLGIAICKDMDFAPMIRDYARLGVRLMLVPAWDFRTDTKLHARMAVVRGIENGFAVARAAADGVLTVSDAYGRVIAETPTDPVEPTVVVADVGLSQSTTLYSRIGDLFGWLAVAALVLVIGLRLRHREGTSAKRPAVATD